MLIDRFAIPVAVFLGILFAIISLYKIMFSDEENALGKLSGLLTWGIVGIIIIMSAKFIGNTLYDGILSQGEI